MSEFAAYNYDTSSGENSPNLEDLSKTPPNNWLQIEKKIIQEFNKLQKDSPNLSEAFNNVGVFADRTIKVKIVKTVESSPLTLPKPIQIPMHKLSGTMTEPNSTIWKPNETWEEQLKKPEFVQKPILHSTDEDKYKKKGNEPGRNLSKSKPGKSAFFSNIDDVQAGGKIDMDGAIDYEEIMDELVQIDKKYMEIIKENKKIWDTALIQNIAQIESANLNEKEEKRLIKDVETSIGSSRTKELAGIWSEYNEKRFDIIKKWKDMNLKTTIMKHNDHVIKNETISTLDASKWFEEATKNEKDWKIEQIKRSEDSIKRTQIELEKLVKKKPNILKKLREKRLKKIKELSKRINDEKNYTNRLKNNHN
jgi:hypothetical protein